MALFRELRSRSRAVLPAVAGLLTLSYFAYHAVNGERGLLAYWRLQESLAEATAELAAVADERAVLEHEVSLLRPGSGGRSSTLSLDMLRERARAVLNHIGPHEVVIFDRPAPAGPAGPAD
ncbi:MAG: septum formation initiator family protein [Alphaproteobacteria bacterium]